MSKIKESIKIIINVICLSTTSIVIGLFILAYFDRL